MNHIKATGSSAEEIVTPASESALRAQSFMELIYIDSDDQACQTGLRRSASTNAQTSAEFRRWKFLAVDIKQARFLLDYHNAKGDLSDTIAIDEEGFRAITGQAPKTDAEYRKIDTDFWNDVRSDVEASKVSPDRSQADAQTVVR